MESHGVMKAGTPQDHDSPVAQQQISPFDAQAPPSIEIGLRKKGRDPLVKPGRAHPPLNAAAKTSNDAGRISEMFHLFPRLPLEIQQMILNFTRPGPRRIAFYEVQEPEQEVLPARHFYEEQRQSIEGLFKDIIVGAWERNRRDGGANEVGDRNNRNDHESRAIPTAPKYTKKTKKESHPSNNATNLPWVMLAVNKDARAFALKQYQFFHGSQFGHGIYINFNVDTLHFRSIAALLLFCGLPKWSITAQDVFGNTGYLLRERSKLPKASSDGERHLKSMMIDYGEVNNIFKELLFRFPKLVELLVRDTEDEDAAYMYREPCLAKWRAQALERHKEDLEEGEIDELEMEQSLSMRR